MTNYYIRENREKTLDTFNVTRNKSTRTYFSICEYQGAVGIIETYTKIEKVLA